MALSTTCLEKLDEFVNQESRIVTYKWFSLNSGISVSSAKKALELFVTHCRSGNVSYTINVTYLVIGGETNPDGRKVTHACVVDEDQLDAVKSSLQPVGTSHVYSVQKARVKDSSTLYAADVDIRNQKWESSNKFSAISCPAALCTKGRPSTVVRKPTAPTAGVKTKATATSAPITEEPSKQSVSTASDDVPESSTKLPVAGKATAGAGRGKQPSAATFFGAAASKKSTKATEKPVKKEEATVDDKDPVDKEGVKAGATDKADNKEGVKSKAAASSSSAKGKSFFGERLPKTKEAKDSAKSMDTASNKTDEGSCEEAKQTNKKEVKVAAKPAVKKPATRGKKLVKAEPVEQQTEQHADLTSDLFDAECDSDDEASAPKASPRKRSSAKVAKQETADLSDLYDAECDSDEDAKPAKKPRGRPKKTAATKTTATTKTTAASKKPIEKDNQMVLKRARKNSDFLEDEGLAAASVGHPEAPKPPPAPLGPRRKRVKKLVTKTHINDAGEFVTEKIYETDSTDASDEEVAPAAKRARLVVPKPTPQTSGASASKPGKAADAKKPAGKAKQASLMSFFKK